MAKIRTLLSSPKANIALFVLAAVLLLGGGIGAGRAALTYFSENYSSQVEMFDIGVSLVENNEIVSYRDFNDTDGDRTVSVSEHTGSLLENMLDENESFQLGHAYPEVLRVKNSGEIDQYVRVRLYKYWLDPVDPDKPDDRKKNRELTPDLIDLHLVNVGSASSSSPWILDEDSSTEERTVLYYRDILPAVNDDETQMDTDDERRFSIPFTDTLTVNSSVADKVSQTVKETENGKVITTTYKYDGVEFRIEADVDAVQTHNAGDAVHSAWGIDPSILNLSESQE